MTKLEDHTAIVMSLFPPMSGIWGFFFYSFLVYLVVMFFGWLLNPTVDKIIADDIKASKVKRRGEAARQENLENERKITERV